MDLLEDPRHRREERRLELDQVGHDLLRVLLPVGDRGADIEHHELDDQREGVRQRQEQVRAVALADQVPRLHRRRDRAVVAVRELARLGRPGRARRVEVQALGVRHDAVDALVKLGLRAPSPPLAQRIERDRAAVRVRGLDDDHELQLRQVCLDGADLRQLFGVLDEHRPRPGVMQHVVALLRRVRLVDRDGNRAGGERRKTGVGPLRPRVRQDRDPVSRLDAHVDEPKRQLPHRPVKLLVGDVDPLATKLVPERRLAAVPRGRQPDQVSHRPRARANPSIHPLVGFSFAQAGDSTTPRHATTAGTSRVTSSATRRGAPAHRDPSRPMRFAFADPPYPVSRMRRCYPEREEVDHEKLIAGLVRRVPGRVGALATSAQALQQEAGQARWRALHEVAVWADFLAPLGVDPPCGISRTRGSTPGARWWSFRNTPSVWATRVVLRRTRAPASE